MHAEDQSAHLNRLGYWPSFNEIFYPATRKVAGASGRYESCQDARAPCRHALAPCRYAHAHAHGRYEDAVRFKLFAELQGNVTSGGAMRRVIAWNDWQHDPAGIAKGPRDAIMMRGDLGTFARDAGGGIDAKYSSVALAFTELASYGRAGPTTDDQPPFCWAREFAQTPHAGHPHCFDFRWASFKPRALRTLAAGEQDPTHPRTVSFPPWRAWAPKVASVPRLP